MAFVHANGLDIYHEIQGGGPRLLFISGTGGDLRVKPNVFDGPLSRRFQVLAYDQRGLGQTSKPRCDYCMADYADDAAALLDALEWPPVPVIGVSFGGMVAQELALRHPDKVRTLVLACTSSGGAGGASYPLHTLSMLSPAEQVERQLVLSDTRRNADWRAAHPEQWQQLRELAVAAVRPDRDADGAARQLVARAGHDTWNRLLELAMPVLVAGGRYDGIAPPENLEAMAARIPGATLRLYDGGHLFMIQDRRAYPEMMDWLESRLN